MYNRYLKHGHFRENNPDIYSETEIKYYITVLRKLNKKKYDDITKDEIDKMIDQHYDKAMFTLKFLMKSICLDYYFERV